MLGKTKGWGENESKAFSPLDIGSQAIFTPHVEYNFPQMP